MRALVLCVAIALLGAAGAASAQEEAVARWTRLEAALGAGVEAQTSFGPLEGTVDRFIAASGRWRTVGKGSATLNLNTGALSFHMEGLSNASATPVLGGPIPTPTVKATVVCYAIRPGSVVFVDTPTITLDDDGDGSFEGTVVLPWQCAAAPAEIVFLVRHDTPTRPAIDGTYIVYGAGRMLRP
jgi:hypothetical protein